MLREHSFINCAMLPASIKESWMPSSSIADLWQRRPRRPQSGWQIFSLVGYLTNMAARFFWDLLLGWLAAVVLAGLIVLGWVALSLPARAQQPPTSNLVSGEASATTTAQTTIIAAPSSTRRLYIKSVECGRNDAGTTAIIATLNDDAATVVVIPNSGGGGANSMSFGSPLTVATATAFKFTASSGVTTLYCNAQGFTGN
jgi:hypothetical protein